MARDYSMRTKDLIKKLQELDPSGELHVYIMSEPIIVAIKTSGLRQEIVWGDEEEVKAINYVRDDEENVIIASSGANDCLFDDPELPIDISRLADDEKPAMAHIIEDMRKRAREARAND